MAIAQNAEAETELDEQTALARANLDRHVAEALAARERLLDAGVDPSEALPAVIQELFDPADWRRERGKSLEGWTEETGDAADLPLSV